MAEKEKKQQIERLYNIPLRKEFLKVPRYRRAEKAVFAIRAFISKHMKADIVKIGEQLNELIWQNGIRNPPSKVAVKAVKREDSVVEVELATLKEKRKKEVKVKEKLIAKEKEAGVEEKVEKTEKKEQEAEEKKQEKTAKKEEKKV